MTQRIYKAGAFLIIDNVDNDTVIELNSSNVQIKKEKTNVDLYNIINADGQSVMKVNLSEIVDVNGDAYTENDWNTFRFEQVGAQNITDVSAVAEYTETIVNVSSADILVMGTTPIELLPAPGVGMYYDIDKIIFEYTFITTAYTSVTPIQLIGDLNALISIGIENTTDRHLILKETAASIAAGIITGHGGETNQSLSITTFEGDNPASGDGTLRIKIYYKTIVFGV